MASGVTGKQFLAASWSVVGARREFLLLPVAAAVSSMVGAALILVPTGVTYAATASAPSLVRTVAAALALWLALFVSTFVSVFFQVALVWAVINHLDGTEVSLAQALAAAAARTRAIAGWSALSATVGVVLSAIRQQGGVAAAVVSWVGVASWAIASFFVVPIIAVESSSPVAALKQSSVLVKRTWGKALRSQVRFGLVQVVALIVPIVVMAAGVVASVSVSPVVGVPLVVLGLCVLIGVVVVFACLGTVLRAMLYRYANGVPTPGVDPQVLAGAMRVSSR